MVAVAGEKINVILQRENGEVIDLTGVVSDLQISSGFDGVVETDIRILGDTITHYFDIKDAKKTVSRMDTWECAYCGTINSTSSLHCGDNGNPKMTVGCGAPRPLVFSVFS